MSEDLNRGACDFSQYDTMTNEALEELLRLDSEAPEGQESDTERLLYIMALLAQRDRQQPTPGKTALEAWESFQQDYLPIEDTDHEEEDWEAKPVTKPVRPRFYRVIAAAAVLALLIAVPVAVHAIGWEDIVKAVAKWSKETFSFVEKEEPGYNEPSPSNTNQYASLQDALNATGQPVDFVPTWLPAEYEFDDISLDETPVQKIYQAIYCSGEKELTIVVQHFIGSDPEKIEISEDLQEIYSVSGTEYYIFSNRNMIRAVWMTGSYMCYFSGELTISEVKMMIDSIGKE